MAASSPRTPAAAPPRRLQHRPRARGALAAAAFLTALAAATPAPVRAQAKLPIDPLEGRYRRELREIERQAVTDPAAAARQASQTRRRLVNEGGGVPSTPERARIDRELGQLEGAVPPPVFAPRGPSDAGEAARRDELPSSYGDESGEALPSMTREIRLVSRLLDRAARGIEEGDPTSVGSDLSTARAGLGDLRSAAAPAADLDSLSRRLEGLQRQLAELPPGGSATAP